MKQQIIQWIQRKKAKMQPSLFSQHNEVNEHSYHREALESQEKEECSAMKKK
jgi:uncharacterized protein YdcH (DUF465 family)